MNQDVLKNLLNRIPWTLGLIGFLSWLGLSYYQFRNSPESPLMLKRAEIDQAVVQIDQLKVKLREAQEFQRTLDVKREELRKLAMELAGMRASLSEDFDVPELIRIVTREAKVVGLRVSSFAPVNEAQQEFYTEKIFKLEFSGVYAQLYVFLQRIASLQKILRVDGLEMTPRGPQNQKYVEIGGSLYVLAYRYSGTKADEIGTSSPSPAPAPASTPTPASAEEGGQ